MVATAMESAHSAAMVSVANGEAPLSIAVLQPKLKSGALDFAKHNGYVVKAQTVQISSAGDAVLRFRDSGGQYAQYCVSSQHLIKRSPYFRSLLDPSRGFAEAQRLKAGTMDHVPAIDVEFPSDAAISASNISWPVSVVRLAHFLRLLHGTSSIQGPVESQRVDDLFFLGICWDRFVISECATVTNQELGETSRSKSRRKIFQPGFFDWSLWNSSHEIESRKLIFACFRLGLDRHLAVLTQKLIVMGSENHDHWLPSDANEQSESIIWHLPAQLEEEIFFRRRTILGTIASSIDQYVVLYSSGKLQCRYGYGNSNACDTFQLGQLLRFFQRKQITDLRSTRSLIGDAEGSSMYMGSIIALVKSLRAIPEAQIDTNHQHCGIRKDLLPVLEAFETAINRDKSIGVCGTCWRSGNSRRHAWATFDMSANACIDQASHIKGRKTFEQALAGMSPE